MNEKKQQQS